MATQQPRYSKEEFARRGNELYERQIRPQVQDGNEGKVVAIDIETGMFEVAEDTLTASHRLLARCPEAQTWFIPSVIEHYIALDLGVSRNRHGYWHCHCESRSSRSSRRAWYDRPNKRD